MMKNIKHSNLKHIALIILVSVIYLGCERELSNQAVEAEFSNLPDIFNDNFVGMGTDFYLPFADSKLDAFSVDNTEGYESNASIRIDVPNASDPEGNYAGAILRVDGAGRNLTSYDALTFWAKASQGVSIDQFGFGQDFLENKYQVTLNGVSVGTSWSKITIPIPDPSKLVNERGMMWYAAGTQGTGGSGYILWIDEIKFENTGTVAQPRPEILNGQNLEEQTFIGSERTIGGLQETFNIGNGQDVTVVPAPAYYDFSSSNVFTATVNELGEVAVLGSGIATITAELAGLVAEGSLTLESLGEFEAAPTPTRSQENVISVFSDAYNNVPVDYYNGFFNADDQTTQGGAPPINIGGNEVINYTDLNFVGVGTFLNVAPINATEMTHFHVDINVQEELDPGDFIRIQLINSVGNNETSGSVTLDASDLVSNGWGSYDIPLGEFTGLGSRSQLGLIFFISDSTVSNIYVDNIYYYKEVVEPTPNVDDSGATQVALPIGFEASLTYNFEGFEGADSEIVANPDPSGINPTATVMRTTKTAGAQFFAGTFIDLDVPIDFSSSQKLRIKTWSPKSGIPVRVRLENADNSVGLELDANTTTTNEWEELEWDFSSQDTSADFVRIVIFFEFIEDLAGDGSTYYFDDIQLLNE